MLKTDSINNVTRGEWRYQTILSALNGLTIQEARNFLYDVSDRLNEQTVVTFGAADNLTDAALLNLATALDVKY